MTAVAIVQQDIMAIVAEKLATMKNFGYVVANATQTGFQ
jgi:hypothetical protein